MKAPIVEKLLVGVPARTSISVFHYDSMNQFHMFGIKMAPVKRYAVQRAANIGVDVARNVLAQKALDEEYDMLYFWDADMVHPPNTLIRLLESKWRTNARVMAGLYYSRSCPQPLVSYQFGRHLHGPHAYMKKHPDRYHEANEENEWTPYKLLCDIMRVDGAGTGCMLIDRDVFIELERQGLRPFFKTLISDNGLKWKMGEDFYFCDSLRKAGISLYLDTTIQGIYHFTDDIAITDGGMVVGL